jgi:hypothetical protein
MTHAEMAHEVVRQYGPEMVFWAALAGVLSNAAWRLLVLAGRKLFGWSLD